MCANPNGTFLRSFFLNCFFLPVFFSGAAAPPVAGFAINLCLRCRFLLVRYRALTRTFASAGVCVRALSPHRKVTTMTEAAVGADLDQPLDMHRGVLTKITLDVGLILDDLANAVDFVLVQVLNFLVRVDAGCGQDTRRTGIADAVDVRERDDHVFVAWKIDACYACHISVPLFLILGAACAWRSRRSPAPLHGGG